VLRCTKPHPATASSAPNNRPEAYMQFNIKQVTVHRNQLHVSWS
jgi:hypothetical protein